MVTGSNPVLTTKIKIMKRFKELLFRPYRSDELFVISGCIGIAVLCMLAV
jgi:hypothetical protein